MNPSEITPEEQTRNLAVARLYTAAKRLAKENDSRIDQSSFATWSAACDELEVAAVEFAEAERKLRQQNLPHHLRDDAPYVVCSKCGRKSWGGNPVGSMCALPQPSGEHCDGIFDRQQQ